MIQNFPQELIEKALTQAELRIYIALAKKLASGKSLSDSELKRYEDLLTKIESHTGVNKQDKYIYTRHEVAEFFDVADITVMKWRDYSDFPKEAILGHNQYNIKLVFKWWYNHFVANEQTLIEIQEAKRRREVAMAELKELQASEEKKQLIRVEQVISDLSFIIQIFKTKIYTLAKSMPPLLYGQEQRTIQKLIKEEIDKILEELSKNIDKICNERKKVKRR